MSLTDFIPIVGPLVGGVASMFGQNSANKTNRQIADSTNAANAQQVQQQMDFQERMYDTRYQKTVADLKAAGINPMLAASLGGGSSPSGASMPNQIGAPSQNIMSGVPDAINSAVSSRRTNYEIENMKKTNSKLDTDIGLSKALTESAHKDAMLKVASARAANASANNMELDSTMKVMRNLIESSPQAIHLKILDKYLDSIGALSATAVGLRGLFPRKSSESKQGHYFDADGVVTGGYIHHSNAIR